MCNLLLKGNPIGKVKGILFDKDGTLSNSEEHLLLLGSLRLKKAIKVFEEDRKRTPKSIEKLKELLNSAYGLSPKGLKPDSTLAVASREHNLISTATVFSLLGEGWPSALKLATEIFDEADNIYIHLKQTKSINPLLPGVIALFKELKRGGIVCSLISNDNEQGIKDFLEINKLEEEIFHFWSCENRPSKPSPEAVQKLCKILKLDPKDCALIGDADSDLLMARQAGIELALGYTGGWNIPPSLKYQHHLIHHWDELSID